MVSLFFQNLTVVTSRGQEKLPHGRTETKYQKITKKLKMQYNNNHSFSEQAHAGALQLVGALM